MTLPAWGYTAPPLWYEHGAQQWRDQLTELAEASGFEIVRWFEDFRNETIGLQNMVKFLRGSGVEAIFVPDVLHLWRIPRYTGRSLQEIRDSMPCKVFVLSADGFAPIMPGPPDPLVVRAREAAVLPQRRGRRWFRLRQRTPGSAS